jgi:hypothetical protein
MWLNANETCESALHASQPQRQHVRKLAKLETPRSSRITSSSNNTRATKRASGMTRISGKGRNTRLVIVLACQLEALGIIRL